MSVRRRRRIIVATIGIQLVVLATLIVIRVRAVPPDAVRLVRAEAVEQGVDPDLAEALLRVESRGDPDARSAVGALGLMQLMPATARRFGVKNSFDPAQNIDGGTRYLRWLMDHFKGDITLVLAGYNAGEHNVKKYGNKIPPFRETRQYVPNVLGYTQTMIDIFVAKVNTPILPGNARRV